MSEALYTAIGVVVTGFFTWLYSKLKTPREQKQSDIELINSAIQPLLMSIKEVTEQNNQLVKKYIVEQDKSIKLTEENNKLLKERSVLIQKVEKLEHQVKDLTDKINNLIKNVTKNSPCDNPDCGSKL